VTASPETRATEEPGAKAWQVRGGALILLVVLLLTLWRWCRVACSQ
jgi:hypothetical protein